MNNLFGFSQYEHLSRSAEISDCGKYRYSLRRSWKTGGNGKVCLFLMLNPSKADALVDDQTIKRCMGFVRMWGYSTLSVRNLFSYRATDPKELLKVEDPVGPSGDVAIRAGSTADLIVCAWGANAFVKRNPERVERVLSLLGECPLYCLALTQGDFPQHPLFVKANVHPKPYSPNRQKG